MNDDPSGDLTAIIRMLAERVAVQDARLAAIEAALETVVESAAETLVSLDELRAEVEPARLVATNAADPSEADRQGRYLRAVAGLRRAARASIPPEARVLVVSRGDDRLLRIPARAVAHFPQAPEGCFSGEYPADDAAAVAHLVGLVTRGGWDTLVIPETCSWWLEHYPAFRTHLHRDWHPLHHDPETGSIFAFDPSRPTAWQDCERFLEGLRKESGRLPTVLDWDTGCGLGDWLPGAVVFPPARAGLERLPYLDASVDLVAIRADARRAADEARRVAAVAVLTVSPPGVAGPGFVVSREPTVRSRERVAVTPPGLVIPQARP